MSRPTRRDEDQTRKQEQAHLREIEANAELDRRFGRGFDFQDPNSSTAKYLALASPPLTATSILVRHRKRLKRLGVEGLGDLVRRGGPESLTKYPELALVLCSLAILARGQVRETASAAEELRDLFRALTNRQASRSLRPAWLAASIERRVARGEDRAQVRREIAEKLLKTPTAIAVAEGQGRKSLGLPPLGTDGQRRPRGHR